MNPTFGELEKLGGMSGSEAGPSADIAAVSQLIAEGEFQQVLRGALQAEGQERR
jgi:hypothetical protein